MRFFGLIPSFWGGKKGSAPIPSPRNTPATYFDSKGVLRVAPSGVMRPLFEYANGVWTQNGLLKEGASSNYVGDVAPEMYGAGVTISKTTDPKFPSFAVYAVTTPATQWVGIRVPLMSKEGSGVVSCYIKPVEVSEETQESLSIAFNINALFDVAPDGTLTGEGSVPVGDGWYRIEGTSASDGNGLQLTNAVAAPLSYLFALPQYEQGVAAATSYIPAVASPPAVRGSDT